MRANMGGVIEGIDINVTTGKDFTRRKTNGTVVIVVDCHHMVNIEKLITTPDATVKMAVVDFDMRVGNGWKQTIIITLSYRPYIVLVKNFTFFYSGN